MMLRPSILAGVLLAGFVPGCARNPAPAAPPPPAHGWRQPWQSDKPLPRWIADPTEGGTRLAAYGSAEYRSDESRSQQRDRAMAAARDELARMLRLRVRNAVRDYLADSGVGVTSFSDAVSQQVAEGTIDGTYQRDEWSNEKTRELFVWVDVDRDVARRLAASVVAAAAAAPQGPAAAHLRAKSEADKGFAELDRLLDRGAGR